MTRNEFEKGLLGQVTALPDSSWDFYWDRIYLPTGTKRKVFRLLLSEYLIGSSAREFALSKTFLFHGPPGNGKSAFSRGLCNKLAKELTNERCFFIGLDTHRLSSHWYGHSMKLIASTFKRIEELASANRIVFCIFEEVESLLTNRMLAISEANPVDAFRAVNEVLRRVDNLSMKFNKVFCLATSNLTIAVDEAYLDRMDRVFYFGYPDQKARSAILKDVIQTFNKKFTAKMDAECKEFEILVSVTDGLSGRQLRKLPIEAMSDSDTLYNEPSRIQIWDMIEATKQLKKDSLKDREAHRIGGV